MRVGEAFLFVFKGPFSRARREPYDKEIVFGHYKKTEYPEFSDPIGGRSFLAL